MITEFLFLLCHSMNLMHVSCTNERFLRLSKKMEDFSVNPVLLFSSLHPWFSFEGFSLFSSLWTLVPWAHEMVHGYQLFWEVFHHKVHVLKELDLFEFMCCKGSNIY